MKSYKTLLFIASLIAMTLTGCVHKTTNPEDKTFTVVWNNYDGVTLEIDEEVKYGTIPTYDGLTPIHPNDDEYQFRFVGWNPSISKVVSDITYTASFFPYKLGDSIPGVDPIMSDDFKTIEYGLYPQTHVNDENIIKSLNALSKDTVTGWYFLDGEYYTKETAKVYNNEAYTFDNGSKITNGESYWFKCEPIKWNILSNNNNQFYLLSERLLDSRSYSDSLLDREIDGQKINPNDYEYSNIRKWLNEDFFSGAFKLGNSYVLPSENDDKITLPSYSDMLNTDYGFVNFNEKSSLRASKTTDYARAKGAWCSKDSTSKYNGSYWTRTPCDEFSYCAWNVNSGGFLSEYAVDGDSHSVRPIICVEI